MSQLEPLATDQYRALVSLVEQARPSVMVQEINSAQIDPATGEVSGVVGDIDGQRFNVKVFRGDGDATPIVSVTPAFNKFVEIAQPPKAPDYGDEIITVDFEASDKEQVVIGYNRAARLQAIYEKWKRWNASKRNSAAKV